MSKNQFILHMKRYHHSITRGFLLAGSLLCFAGARAQQHTASADTTVALPYHAADTYETGPFLKTRKTLSVRAAASVSGEDLSKTPVPNITNTLYGRVPGLFVQQGSGEPGYDGASLSIRGKGTYDNASMTIYVDGFQTTSSYFQYLSPSEIESITVLKDAAALATFGMKGANGVLWVVTRRGQVSKPKVAINVVNGIQQAINIDKPYGSYDYARLYNQAISNDNYALNNYQFNWTPKYSDAQLQAYKDGSGTNVDWYDQVLRKSGSYTNANVVFSGGDVNTRYGVILDYMRQQGLYNVGTNDNTSNAQIQRFNIRTNLDFNFFKIFEAKVDLGGRIEDRRYPNYNGPQLWQDMAAYPSNIYPVKDSATGNWSGTTIYANNPVASLHALGWASTHDRTLQANFNLKEKLDFITPGLYMNEAVSFNTWTRASASKTATYARYDNGIQTTTDKTTQITSNGTSSTDQYDWKQANITAGYDRSFGPHAISAAVNYYASNYVVDYGTNGSGQNNGNNIFYHFENIGGRFHYAYQEKYLAELGFGYSGSDEYAPGNRWGFYPAVGLGWVLSKESFLKDNSWLSFLKLRASAGKSGNDASNQGRYLYQQYFVTSGTYYTGTALTGSSGIVQSYVANPKIFAEKSMKYDVGVDATVLDALSLTADVFLDKRSGIVTKNTSLLADFGGSQPYANIGKVTNKGIELSASYHGKSGKVEYTVGAMLTYAQNKINYQAEVPPVNSFSKTTGQPIGTPTGLIATGFYDVADFNADGTLVSGEATPQFGAVQPGDIKYKDLDGNGKIDQNDVTKIGKPSFPSMTYAFNAGISFKGIDLAVVFQGAAGSDVNLYTAAYYQTVAFVNNINVYPTAGNAWAYFPSQGIDTRAKAKYPRLTTEANTNNYQNSTFWMKNGSFLRIRNAELGYSFSSDMLRKLHMEKLRIYINAANPVTWGYLKKHYNLDPETPSGYAGLKSYNAGITLNF
ncbi:MAG: SusC/RagA family TonB-linked outer membrane protein [Ilumatobacteraceae bacterium]